MSTQTLAESSRLLALLLMDQVQVLNVGPQQTEGINVIRPLTPVGDPIDALVQHTTLENAVESLTGTTYSVKVRQGTALEDGQAVRVLSCAQEPSLVGQVLLLDKVSKNGAAMIRKAVGRVFNPVDQQGKEGLE